MSFDYTKFKQQLGRGFNGDLRSLIAAVRQIGDAIQGLSDTEIAFVDGVTAGTGAASKAMVLDSSKNFAMPAGGRFKFSETAPAAAGSAQSDATALTEQINLVTGADGAKGVALPAAAAAIAVYIHNTDPSSALLVYPVNGGNDQINSLTASTGPFVMGPGKAAWFIATSGTQWYVPNNAGLVGKVYTNTAASGAVSSTASETKFDKSYSIPANTLNAGALIKFRFQGIATAHNASDTLAIKAYIGGTSGTALISMSATNVSVNDVFQGEYELVVRDIGASGHIVGAGTYKSIPAAEGTMTIKDDILASTAIDTTAAQELCVSATWSSNSASNSCRLDVVAVEIL